MALQNINTGTPNQKDGDKLRDAFIKVKEMFIELYSFIKTNTSELVNDGVNGTDTYIETSDSPVKRVSGPEADSFVMRNYDRSTSFLPIGSNSFDFTKYFSHTSNVGVSGDDGFSFGYDNVVQGYSGFAFGYKNIISTGSNYCVGFGYDNLLGGYNNFILGTESSNTSTGYSLVSGRHNVNTGTYSGTFGLGLINRGYGTVIGISNIERGQTNYSNINNPLFIIGNGNVTNDNANSPTTRSDAFEVLKSGLVAAPSLTTALIDSNTKALVTREYLQANAGGGELEKITENAKTGFRLKGSDPANFAEIGEQAVDLSISNFANTGFGASGKWSFAVGNGSTASGENANCLGTSIVASGRASFATGNFGEASGIASAILNQNNRASGDSSTAIGLTNYARSLAEFSVGLYGTDYTPTGTVTDRVFNVGNGVFSGGVTPKDAFTIYKNGSAKLHPVPQSSIANATAGSIIIDSADSNKLKFHDGTAWRTVNFV